MKVTVTMADMSPIVAPRLGVKAIVLDLDGTLLDTRQDFLVALNRMLDDLTLPHVDEAFVSLTVGKGTQYLIAQTLKKVCSQNVEIELEELATKQYLQHYSEINGDFSSIYPGVTKGLNELHKQGYVLACLTNKPSALAGPVLIKKGLAHFFQCVFGGDAFIRKKPDPLPLIRTCEALHVLPSEVVMVGDSENDAFAGRDAHSAVALMRYGYNHGKPIDEVKADFYLNSLVELPALLYKL